MIEFMTTSGIWTFFVPCISMIQWRIPLTSMNAVKLGGKSLLTRELGKISMQFGGSGWEKGEVTYTMVFRPRVPRYWKSSGKGKLLR
jgi:hypothetical protein